VVTISNESGTRWLGDFTDFNQYQALADWAGRSRDASQLLPLPKEFRQHTLHPFSRRLDSRNAVCAFLQRRHFSVHGEFGICNYYSFELARLPSEYRQRTTVVTTIRAKQISTNNFPPSNQSTGEFLRSGSVKRLCQKSAPAAK
jgi:hypothetical protein